MIHPTLQLTDEPFEQLAAISQDVRLELTAKGEDATHWGRNGKPIAYNPALLIFGAANNLD